MVAVAQAVSVRAESAARVYLPMMIRGDPSAANLAVYPDDPSVLDEVDLDTDVPIDDEIELERVVESVQPAAAAAVDTYIRKYYFFGGQRIAMWTNAPGGAGFRYLHGDHLGSTVLETRTDGQLDHARGYLAFGGYREALPGSASLVTDALFTGQREDDTGLVHMNARYYDPAIGQFISPDTIVPDPGKVFGYNRYMYTYGDPLKYTDPTGHCVFGLDTIVCVIAGAALAGGVANGTGNVAVQVTQNWDSERSVGENLTSFNKTEAGIAFGFGATGGALAPVTGGATAVLANGALGAMQEVTTDVAVDGSSVAEAFDTETAFAFGSGLIGGLVQGAMPDELIYGLSEGHELGVATGREALETGERWFANSSNRQLFGEQLKYVFSGRFIVGATVGNVPLPGQRGDQADGCGFWQCPVEKVRDWLGSKSQD